jgi:hypothetical protein
MPNACTYGEMAFGTSGVPPGSTYRIAPSSNRLQKNMYGNRYSEFMDYSAIDAFLNPGYGAATGMPTRRPRNLLTVNFRQPRVLVIHWFQL